MSAQRLALVTLNVRDYDEALAYYVGILGFELVEDTDQPDQGKRWVVVRPRGSKGGGEGAGLVLGRVTGAEQAARVGDQTGGRVAFFLQTDDFWRDYRAYAEKGVVFVRDPVVAPYGTVAVFRDLYGNLWDLVEFAR